MCLLDLASWLSLYTGRLSACAPCAVFSSCQGVSQACKDGEIGLLVHEVRRSRRQSSHRKSEAVNVNTDNKHTIDTNAQQHSWILSKAVFAHCVFMDLHVNVCFLDFLKCCASAALVISSAHSFALLRQCNCAS